MTLRVWSSDDRATRRDSTLSKNHDDHVQERRSSLKSLFTKVEMIEDETSSSTSGVEEQHLKLFKSKEFKAYLKEKEHSCTTTNAVRVMFQQFLTERNIKEGINNSKIPEKATTTSYTRKNSGDSLLSFAANSLKRRGRSGSEIEGINSEKSLDESGETIWSVDDSCRQAYMDVIRYDTEILTFVHVQTKNRGDIDSLLQQPQEELEVEQQVNGVEEENSSIRNLIRRSSSTFTTSIDTFRERRGSLFSSVGARSNQSSLHSLYENPVAAGQSDDKLAKSKEVGLEDLLKDLSKNSSSTEDDESNNGEVEFFFPSRRRSSSTCDYPPRRSSLVLRSSETSSHLRKCLDEIIDTSNLHGDRILRDNDATSSSEDVFSLGSFASNASDQALLCESSNREGIDFSHPEFVEVDYNHQAEKLIDLPRTYKVQQKSNSCSNLAPCDNQVKKDFIASRGSLLVEWGDTYNSEDDSV